jgi:hypothetical protein
MVVLFRVVCIRESLDSELEIIIVEFLDFNNAGFCSVRDPSIQSIFAIQKAITPILSQMIIKYTRVPIPIMLR